MKKRRGVPRPKPAPALAFRWAVAIFATAAAVRLIHLWFLRESPFFFMLMGDSRGYHTWAQQIAAGDWMGTEVFYQAPLYPYFVGSIYSLLGESLLAVRIVQALLGSIACVLLGLAAARLFSPRVGLIAGLALALYAPAIFMDSLIQKSILDVFFICLAIWLIAQLTWQPNRARQWIALGISLGALTLTRENAIVLIVVVLAWAILHQTYPTNAPHQRPLRHLPPVRRAVFFVLGLALVLTPVALRNKAVGGGFYLTTSQFGSNFYIGNNPRSDGTYISLREGRGDPQYERQDATELAERALGRTLTPAEVSDYWRDRALQYITSQPGDWLELLGRKVRLLFNAREMLDTESQESHAEWSPLLRIAAIIGHFGVLLPLAVLGGIVAWPERKRLWVIYALALGYAASVVMFFVFARYRYPLVPFVVVFAAAGLGAFPSYIRKSTQRRTIATSVVVIAVAAFAQWPVLDANTMRAITETNLGVAFQERQQFAEAERHYRRAAEIKPDHAPSYSNMGVTLRAQGRLDEAIAAYRRALELRGDYTDAQYNLANALMARGDTEQAIALFRQVIQSTPDKAGGHNNLGVALASVNRLDEAIVEFRLALEIDPRSVRALRNLGDALAQQQKYDEAIRYMRQAIDVDPTDAANHYDLGSVLLESGRYTEAVEALRAALNRAPNAPQIHNNLGIALASQGKMVEAIAEFRRALAIDPNFEDAKRNLARATKGGG